MSEFGGTNVPPEYQAQVLASAARWNIAPSILAAQLDAESGFNPHVVSPAGAEGIAQFLPSTAASIGVDPWNPSSAIDGMAQLDASYLKQFGSIDKALAAYNAGPGAVSQYGGIPPYAETQNYVKKILAAAGVDPSWIPFPVPGGGFVPLPSPGDIQAIDPLLKLTQLANALRQPAFWRRIGVAVLGLTLILAGVYFALQKEGGSYKVARQIAGNLK